MKRLGLLVLIAMGTPACHGGSAGSVALTGRLDAAVANHAVAVATDRAGRTQTAAIAADGTFRLTLPARATYRIVVRSLDSGTETPMVFPRSAAVQSTLRVRGAGAARDLGLVRVLPATVSVLTAGTTGSTEQCMDGVDPAGQACVDDGAENDQTSCGADQEDNTQDGDQSESAGEGNDTTAAASNVNPSQVLVPTVNPPTEVGDCGDEGGAEQKDDGNGEQ